MATSRGFVQRWTSNGTFVCFSIGNAPASTELFFVQIASSEPDETIFFKRGLANALAQAQLGGRQVEIDHGDDSAEVLSVRTPAGDPNQHPIRVEGVEVTQSIQDLSQSIPLIAGKRTVVRLYLSHASAPAPVVRATLALRRGPSDPIVTLPSLNTVALDPAQAGNVAFARNHLTRSLNFLLPETHTAEGPLVIELATVTDVTTNQAIAFEAERRPTVWFHRSAPLRLRVLGMRYQQGAPAVTHMPANLDFALLLSWLRRAYPVGEVVASQAIVDVTATVPFDSDDINAQLASLRAADMAAGGDQRMHYYGLVSDGGFFMQGKSAGIPSTPDPSTVACGPTGAGTWGWDFDGSYGDWYGGHELGHTFGRKHPGFCNETQSDLDNYPFPNGQLARTDQSFAGFDVGDPDQSLAMDVLPGQQWRDVMTYCAFQWLSPYTYEGIRRRLAEEDRLGAGASGSSGSSPTAGRPDQRFPSAASDPEREGCCDGDRIAVSVVAKVNLTTRTGRIVSVTPVPKMLSTAASDSEGVALRLRDERGRVLLERPVEVKLGSEAGPLDDRTGLVDAVIAVDAAARRVDLLIHGEVVDVFTAAVTPPIIRAVRLDLQPDVVRVRVEFDEPVRDGQSYWIQVSTDRGRSWQTFGIGLRGSTCDLERGQFRDAAEIRVRVHGTNGFSSRVVTSDAHRI